MSAADLKLAAQFQLVDPDRMRYQGPYAPATPYVLGDVVVSGAVTYVCIAPSGSLGQAPPGANWAVLGDGTGIPQTLSLAGNVISLSGGGGSVDISGATAVALSTQKLTAVTYDGGLLSTEVSGQLIGRAIVESAPPALGSGAATLDGAMAQVKITSNNAQKPTVRFVHPPDPEATIEYDPVASEFVFNPPLPAGGAAWSTFPAVQDVDMSCNRLTDASGVDFCGEIDIKGNPAAGGPAFLATQNQSIYMGFGGTAAPAAAGTGSVAIGHDISGCQSDYSVAIGFQAAGDAAQPQQTLAIAIGNAAGLTNQQTGAVAVGKECGNYNQGERAVALGWETGRGDVGAGTSQGQQSIAIGTATAYAGQGVNAVAIGQFCQFQGPYSDNCVAIGNSCGSNQQGDSAVAIGHAAGQNTQAANAVAIGFYAGNSNQLDNSIAIGYEAGKTDQSNECVAIGFQAGLNTQQYNCVAIGNVAGADQQNYESVAIGARAAQYQQGKQSVAIGASAGQGDSGAMTYQGADSVAIGVAAAGLGQGAACVHIGPYCGTYGPFKDQCVAVGYTAGGTAQGEKATAIGTGAGANTQGDYAVALGFEAGKTNQHANSIVINATGVAVDSDGANRCFVAPIRTEQVVMDTLLHYDATTKEVKYNTLTSLGPLSMHSVGVKADVNGLDMGNWLQVTINGAPAWIPYLTSSPV